MTQSSSPTITSPGNTGASPQPTGPYRDPDIAARYNRGKAKAIAHVARGLLQKARSGDTVSSIFFLKTEFMV
jgi:hypothetical protein